MVEQVAGQDTSGAPWTNNLDTGFSSQVLALYMADKAFLRVENLATLGTFSYNSSTLEEGTLVFHPHMGLQAFLVLKSLSTILALNIMQPSVSCLDVFYESLHPYSFATLWAGCLPLHVNPQHMPL